MSCLYLIKDNTNNNYYIGSHKDAKSVEDRTYKSSSEPLNEAITAKGIDNFSFTVLKTFGHRYTAYQAEKNLLEAMDAANDEKSYNQTNTVMAKRPNLWTRIFYLPKQANTPEELNAWVKQITDAAASEPTTQSNDFNFESNLGLFLDRGFDAYTEEGDRQGYDDPSEANWVKQVALLKVQLNNNIDREYFIKHNKFTILEEAFKNMDEIVGDQIEFIMQKKRAENEMNYIIEQRELAAKEEGWYLMLHEALHDGFQEGSKRKIDELNQKYGLS